MKDEVIIYLQHWIDRHIKKTDMEYIHYMKPYQQSESYALFVGGLKSLVIGRYGEKSWKKATRTLDMPKDLSMQVRVSEELLFNTLSNLSEILKVQIEELLDNLGTVIYIYIYI